MASIRGGTLVITVRRLPATARSATAVTQAEGSAFARTPTSAPSVTSAGPTRPTVSHARWCRGRGPPGPRVVRREDGLLLRRPAPPVRPVRVAVPRQTARHPKHRVASTNTHTAAKGRAGPTLEPLPSITRKSVGSRTTVAPQPPRLPVPVGVCRWAALRDRLEDAGGEDLRRLTEPVPPRVEVIHVDEGRGAAGPQVGRDAARKRRLARSTPSVDRDDGRVPQRGCTSRASSTTASTCTGSAGSVIWSHMSATLLAIYAGPRDQPQHRRHPRDRLPRRRCGPGRGASTSPTCAMPGTPSSSRSSTTHRVWTSSPSST